MSQNTFNELKKMIIQVAEALGPDLLASTAFVGGVTTGLLLTDELALQSVRATDDVDLIIDALGYSKNAEFEETLRSLGFVDRMDGEVIGRKWLGEVQVDFMSTDKSFGFTNRWYKEALESAENYSLTSDLTIRLLTPEYFVATKLEAYNGRGNGDMLESRDLEDIMSLINGRDTIVEDIKSASTTLLQYIIDQLKLLSSDQDFEYLIQSTVDGDSERAEYVYEVIDEIIGRTCGE